MDERKSMPAKSRPGSQSIPTGYLCVSPDLLFTSIVSEILEYFDDARVSGVFLAEYQARYIANGIFERVLRDERRACELPKEIRRSGPLPGQSVDAD
jgi:hypothetical protein